MAPGLWFLGKWLKPPYNHGAEKQRKVEISNQDQEMASQFAKEDSSQTYFIFLIPSLLRGSAEFFHGAQGRPPQDQAPAEPQRSLSCIYYGQSLTIHRERI